MKVYDKVRVDEKCKAMFEDLKSKSEEEVRGMLRQEMERLIARGITGVSLTSYSDCYPDDGSKKDRMVNMIVCLSLMNKEDSHRFAEEFEDVEVSYSA